MLKTLFLSTVVLASAVAQSGAATIQWTSLAVTGVRDQDGVLLENTPVDDGLLLIVASTGDSDFALGNLDASQELDVGDMIGGADDFIVGRFNRLNAPSSGFPFGAPGKFGSGLGPVLNAGPTPAAAESWPLAIVWFPDATLASVKAGGDSLADATRSGFNYGFAETNQSLSIPASGTAASGLNFAFVDAGDAAALPASAAAASLSVIPEPGSSVLSLLGGILLLRRRR